MSNQTPSAWPLSVIVGRSGPNKFTLDELDSDRAPTTGEMVYLKTHEVEAAPTAVSKLGLQFLAYLEGGVRLYPYDDLTAKAVTLDEAVSGNIVGHLAIGVGRTLFDGMYTPEQLERWIDEGVDRDIALQWLDHDSDTAVVEVLKCQAGMTTGDNALPPFTQQQFDALVCFVFNIGTGAFKASTLRRKLLDADMDRCELVKRELPRWKYSRGRRVDGLLNRRNETIELFCEGDYIPQWFMGHG